MVTPFERWATGCARFVAFLALVILTFTVYPRYGLKLAVKIEIVLA